MRIVIAGPPKTGNVWLKRLLASTYGLRLLETGAFPERPNLPDLEAWLRDTGFPDNSIFHQHYDYTPGLADALEAVPAHLVTIVRNPYDTFVSAYFAQQKAAESGQRMNRRNDPIAGKPIDSPEVYEYLRSGGFRRSMMRARDWIQSGRSHIVRYEDLMSDPVAALGNLAERLGHPVPVETLERAIEINSAENLRKMGGDIANHVRVAKVGDSHDKLTDQHLQIFRDLHAALITDMGYEVR